MAFALRMPHCEGMHHGVCNTGVELGSATSLIAARLARRLQR